MKKAKEYLVRKLKELTGASNVEIHPVKDVALDMAYFEGIAFVIRTCGPLIGEDNRQILRDKYKVPAWMKLNIDPDEELTS